MEKTEKLERLRDFGSNSSDQQEAVEQWLQIQEQQNELFRAAKEREAKSEQRYLSAIENLKIKGKEEKLLILIQMKDDLKEILDIKDSRKAKLALEKLCDQYEKLAREVGAEIDELKKFIF